MLETCEVGDLHSFRGSTCTRVTSGRRATSVFRCSGPSLISPAAVKYFGQSDGRLPAGALARHQFEALEAVSRLTDQSSTVRVPRPLRLLEEQRCVVMEWIDGPSVDDLLWSIRSSGSKVARVSRQAGAWLRAFHALRPAARRPIHTSMMLADVETILTQGRRWENPTFDAARDLLIRTSAQVSAIELPVAWHYMDFKPDNLIASNGSLVGIDIGAWYDEVVILDIACFVRDIELRSWHASAWPLSWRKRQIIDNFITGYLGSDSLTIEGPLSWVYLQGLLRFWARFEASATSSVKDLYQRQRFVAWAHRTSARIRQLLD
jgi:hypothetical protein